MDASGGVLSCRRTRKYPKKSAQGRRYEQKRPPLGTPPAASRHCGIRNYVLCRRLGTFRKFFHWYSSLHVIVSPVYRSSQTCLSQRGEPRKPVIARARSARGNPPVGCTVLLYVLTNRQLPTECLRHLEVKALRRSKGANVRPISAKRCLRRVTFLVPPKKVTKECGPGEALRCL